VGWVELVLLKSINISVKSIKIFVIILYINITFYKENKEQYFVFINDD